MEKINNWNEIEVKGVSDFVSLPAGAYSCKILSACEYKNDQTGNKSLKVMVDIADGEFKDYFKKRYDSDTRVDKKYDNNACKYLGLGETGLPFLKGFITCVENSNAGYTWNWDEETLKGKKIGCIFSYEEYLKQDGTKGVKVKLSQFRSIDKLKDVPEQNKIKLLDGSHIDFEEYKKGERTYQGNDLESLLNSMPTDEEFPF